MTRALSIQIRNPLRVFVVASLFAIVVCAMPLTARAAALNETQISSILLLLSSFGGDRALVSSIESTMRNHGANSGSSRTAFTEAQVSAILRILSSFRADQTLISSIETTLRNYGTNSDSSSSGSSQQTSTAEARLDATPSSGSAPLSVSFEIQVYDGGNYTLQYGDGTSELIAVPAVQCVTAPCYPPAFTKTHVYQEKGNYTARLRDRNNSSLATRSVRVSRETQESSNVTAPTDPVVISSFEVSPSSVEAGKKVTFSWETNLTDNDLQNHLAFCSIEGMTAHNQALNVVIRKQAKGTVSYSPSESALYTLVCSSSAKDDSPVDSAQVTVDILPGRPACAVKTSKDSVRVGESYTISWTSTNASSISGLGESSLPLQGSMTGAHTVAGKRTHIFNVEGPGGSATCKKEINVKSSVSFGPLEYVQAYSEAFDQNLAATIGAMGYMPESLYETMSQVPDLLASIGAVPAKAMAASLGEALYQTGLY